MTKITHVFTTYFRSISQAFFFDNGYFGAALLGLLFYFEPHTFFSGVLASVIGHIYSLRFRTPVVLKEVGLISLNGFFFGIAMASLFQKSSAYYPCLILGAMVIPMLVKAFFEVLQHWKLSPLITPYIFAVWALWLSSRGAGFELRPLTVTSLEWDLPYGIEPVLQSMARILFLPNPLFGIAIFALVTFFSLRRGLFFLGGTLIAVGVGYLVSGGSLEWQLGYTSYGPGLVGLGLASYPEKFNWRTIFLFCAISSIFTMATDELLREIRLPVLSLPYVLTFWLATLSRTPRVNLSWEPKNGPFQALTTPSKVDDSRRSA